MRINEYLQMRYNNAAIISSPSTAAATPSHAPENDGVAVGGSFQATLQKKLESQVEFSKHAINRLEQRSIDLLEDDKLERLNKGIQAAQEKGANETLVLVDKTAFLVSIRNNKVITTMTAEDLKGNVFTNIDSTVIM